MTVGHTANSDKDCFGVCFGEKKTGCDIAVHVSRNDLDYQLGVQPGRLRQSQEVVISNDGTHGAILYSTTPVLLNRGYAPLVEVRASANNQSVSINHLEIGAKSSVSLTIEAELESFVNHELRFSGGRKGETISVQLFLHYHAVAVRSLDAESDGGNGRVGALVVQHDAVRVAD